MEMKKYGSKLYKPMKPYHEMTIKELCDHNKICRSLDKMSYEKIQRLENLPLDVIKRKMKRFLERNNKKKTKRLLLKKIKTRKKLMKRGGKSRKQRKLLHKKSMKSKQIL